MDALINETYFLNPNITEDDIESLNTTEYTIGLQTFSGEVTTLIHNILLQIFSLNKQKIYFFFLKDLHEFMDKMYNESTLMHIHFKELGVVKYRKDQLYSELDLMG